MYLESPLQDSGIALSDLAVWGNLRVHIALFGNFAGWKAPMTAGTKPHNVPNRNHCRGLCASAQTLHQRLCQCKRLATGVADVYFLIQIV